MGSRRKPGYWTGLGRGRSRAEVLRAQGQGKRWETTRMKRRFQPAQRWELSYGRYRFPLCIQTHGCFVSLVLVKPASLWENHQNLHLSFLWSKELWGFMEIKITDLYAGISIHSPATLYGCVEGWHWWKTQLSWPLYNTDKTYGASLVLCLHSLGLQPNWDQGGLRHMCGSLWLWAYSFSTFSTASDQEGRCLITQIFLKWVNSDVTAALL